MAQVFHRSSNALARFSLLGAVLLIGGGLTALLTVGVRSAFITQQTVFKVQPVQFSHQHHAGGIGIDCRYCHTSVETSANAGIPPTKTCLNCHSQIWLTSPYLEPVREAFKNEVPLQWTKVHDLPDFVYFNHSIHINKGVGCSTCHGRVDRMPLMWQVQSLQMEWCLECHRNPEKFVRPKDKIYEMEWPPVAKPETEENQQTTEALAPRSPEAAKQEGSKAWNQDVEGPKLVKEYKILGPNVITSCSTCHR